jgi:cytochrome P450
MIERALDTLRAYTEPLLEERRRAPKADFLSILVETEESHGRLTTDELVWGTVNLLLAGIDTTSYQLASTLMHLVTSRCWDQVAGNTDLRDGAIEEAMRLTPVPTINGRTVHEELVIDDVRIPVGADVKINLVGAGRDPAAFDEPHTYRLDRPRPYFPALFGNGIHVCIGKNLAWEELRVGVEEITKTLTDVTFTDVPPMQAWTDSFAGPFKLPVSFGRL